MLTVNDLITEFKVKINISDKMRAIKLGDDIKFISYRHDYFNGKLMHIFSEDVSERIIREKLPENFREELIIDEENKEIIHASYFPGTSVEYITYDEEGILRL